MNSATAENAYHAAAIEYAARGYAVFPIHSLRPDGNCTCGELCGSAAKHPRTRRGLHDASKDSAIIDRWWTQWPESNVGIVTGETSGFFVLDIDGEEGEQSLESLLADGREFPPTLSAATGGGGRHILFRHPGGVKIKNSTSKLGIGIDIRGDGGYIVAPPSIHASGNFYQWFESTGDIADAPQWLLDLVIESPKPPALPAPPPTKKSPTVLGPGRYTGALYSTK